MYACVHACMRACVYVHAYVHVYAHCICVYVWCMVYVCICVIMCDEGYRLDASGACFFIYVFYLRMLRLCTIAGGPCC